MTETESVPENRLKFGATEYLYLAGVALLLSGLWIWFGLGEALAGTGFALMLSASFNDWMKHREAMNATV